jgi:hypothetical protein
MSENTKEIEIIPMDCVIELKISGQYVARFHQFLQDYYPYKDEQHKLEVFKNVKEDTNNEDPFVYHLKTLLALQVYIEKCAKQQNLIKKVNYDLEKNAIIEEETQSDPQTPTQSESPDSVLP